ncbi:MAG TPA: type II toxin-antitoxin system prevent-host-death family antitoxin [Terriglobales bacterium]|nr:type II toxin-antitoxin system prevent-host-death family antitoxin [Terriglobales bacterium]
MELTITITATEANRTFSQILRGVRQGNRYIITSRGEPVAELGAPGPSAAEVARRRAAWEELEKRLESQPAMNLPRITRDEMHER